MRDKTEEYKKENWAEYSRDVRTSNAVYNNAFSNALSRLGISQDELKSSLMNSLLSLGLSQEVKFSKENDGEKQPGTQVPSSRRLKGIFNPNSAVSPSGSYETSTSDNFISTSSDKISQSSDNATFSQGKSLVADTENLNNETEVRYRLESGDNKTEAERQMAEVRAKYEGADQWLKAPNGKPTKLNERQWLQVRTENFKNWFGDWENDPKNASKVVDENGEPMVVYHGSQSDKPFHVFGEDKASSQGSYLHESQKAYFFADYKTAKNYEYTPKDPTREPMAVFLRAKDPMSIDVNHKVQELLYNFDGDISEAEQYGYPITRWMGDAVESFEDNHSAVAYFDDNAQEIYGEAKEGQHDGISIDGADGTFMHIAFAPTQIKSATGNTGAFDPQNPDIRYRLTDPEVNAKFNEDLSLFAKNELPKRHKFSLGSPGLILIESGFPDAHIEMLIGVLKDKIRSHDIDTGKIINLPQAINDPVFVAKSKSKERSLVVFTEIEHADGNLMVAVSIDKVRDGIKVNDIRSIYGKNSENIIAWFRDDQEQFTYINENKSLDWLNRSAGSQSRKLAQATKAIDKIASRVGLSSAKFLAFPHF